MVIIKVLLYYALKKILNLESTNKSVKIYNDKQHDKQ